ncbi:hypothetical protein AQUCO_01100465v1 [Aquilegia coerulea]|uniref:Uncharacterized protein n=1 Tax=Aquilegia coerulea TaxID=218851 RepID=A0A2G5E7A3_AQUCA|nr:hypothetical protein AQUCO_01100465v1 [Aquilegia coerulea]
MKKNRARTKSSSWLCFQIDCKKEPDDDFDSKPRSIDPVKKIVVKQNEEKMPIAANSIEKNWFKPKMKKSSSYSSSSEKEICRRSRSGSSSRRTLSKIVKAVLFETTMTKSKRIKQEPCRDISDLKTSKEMLKKDVLDSKICSKEEVLSTSSSSSLSSSILSSCSSSSNLCSMSERKKSSSFRSNSLEQKQILLLEESKQSKENNNITRLSPKNGLFLLLISLMVLIFWGRICAIICTSTWVYFGPVGRSNLEKEDNNYDDNDEGIVLKPAEQEMESREYKKRVIMEGLLERSHSRF